MVGPRTVGDDVNPLQAQINVRTVGGKQFFAGLGRDGDAVGGFQGQEPKGATFLSLDGTDDGGDGEGFVATFDVPGGKVTVFTVVAVVGHVQLGPNDHDLMVQTVHTAVVPHPTMQHGHPEITEQLFCECGVLQQLSKHLPRVAKRVALQKVIFASVTSDFQFGTQSVRRTTVFGLKARLNDALVIAFEIQSVLVEIASGKAHHGWKKEGHGAAHHSRDVVERALVERALLNAPC